MGPKGRNLFVLESFDTDQSQGCLLRTDLKWQTPTPVDGPQIWNAFALSFRLMSRGEGATATTQRRVRRPREAL